MGDIKGDTRSLDSSNAQRQLSMSQVRVTDLRIPKTLDPKPYNPINPVLGQAEMVEVERRVSNWLTASPAESVLM